MKDFLKHACENGKVRHEKTTKLWSASQKGNEKMASMLKYEVTVH